MAIPEAELREIQRLHLRLSREANSSFVGELRSAFRGVGMAFEEVRHYVPGDDVRRIDWNVTARTSIPHVKIFREERELNVHLAVDVSGSMVYGSPVYKGHLANLVAGSLAFACARNRDNVSLCQFSDRIVHSVPSSSNRAHVWNIIRHLHSASLTNQTSFSSLLDHFGGASGQIICICSDFLATDWHLLRQLCGRNQVHAFLLYDSQECGFNLNGILSLRDAETGRKVRVDTRQTQPTMVIEQRVDSLRDIGLRVTTIGTHQDFISRLRDHFQRFR